MDAIALMLSAITLCFLLWIGCQLYLAEAKLIDMECKLKRLERRLRGEEE